MDKDITTADAVQQLIKALNEDDGYRESWKANIAVAFKDEFYDKQALTERQFLRTGYTIHSIANAAADRFLNLLTRNEYPGMPVLPDGSSFFVS